MESDLRKSPHAFPLLSTGPLLGRFPSAAQGVGGRSVYLDQGKGRLATRPEPGRARHRSLSDLNLGKEYAAVAHAFTYTWDDMVQIALDGVEACWLPESDKAALRRRIIEAGTTLRPEDDSHA